MCRANVENFKFNNENETWFVQASGNRAVNALYMVFLWCATFTSVTTTALSMHNEAQLQPNRPAVYLLAYATNQSAIVCELYLLMQAIVVTKHFIQGWSKVTDLQKEEKPIKLLCQFLWVLHTFATPTALTVVLMRWLGLDTKFYGFLDVSGHGLIAAFMLSEILWLRRPLRWHHFYVALLFPAWYAVFCPTYLALGGTNMYGGPLLYSIFDYKDGLPLAIMTTVAVCVGTVLLHFANVGIYLLKLRLFRAREEHSRCDEERITLTEHSECGLRSI